MADIEPYKQIKKTNIQEHNDLVAKINEIIDVVNQTNMETIVPKIAKLEQDVSEITANDTVQDGDISSLKTKTAKLEQDVSEITANDTVQNNDISSLKTKTAKLEQDVSGINATDSLQWNDIESMKTDIGTINPKITKMEQDITTINDTDTLQSADIQSLKSKNSEQDSTLATHTGQIDGITKSLVSNVVLMNGTTTGNMKVRVGREDAPSIDSNDYNIQKPTSVELVQGSAPAMVKAQITLSDGTVLVSDDFMFTTEAIGQDVYISSFVFKNGNVDGSISADIGLSNGSTLEANNFVVPTDPNVTTAISDIQGRVTTVENDVSGLKTTVNGHTTAINGLNSDVSGLKTTVNGHTTAINGLNSDVSGLKTTVNGHTASISALDSDVADLQVDKADADNSAQTIVAGSISATNISKGGVSVATVNDIPSVPDISGKADLNNSSQTIIAGTINATNINKGSVAVATVNDIPDISGKVNIAQGSGNAGKVMGINASGNVEPVTISTGEVWEEVDLTNFPKDWTSEDKVRFNLKRVSSNSKTPSSWTNTNIEATFTTYNEAHSNIIELDFSAFNDNILINMSESSNYINVMILDHLTNLYTWNSAGKLFNLKSISFNGGAKSSKSEDVNPRTEHIYKMWRLKK